MKFDLGYISVAAGDFADIITEARRVMEEAAGRNHQTGVDVHEWTVAITRLEAFRTNVAAMLGVSSLETDTHLFDELRKLTATKREWQCQVCAEWVAGTELLCPTCTGPDTQDAGEERTGRFEPVAQPTAQPIDGTDNAGVPRAWPLARTQEPAHALDEPTQDTEGINPSVLSELLHLVGVTVSTEQIENFWSDEMRMEAVQWASAMHHAADSDSMKVPPVPAFLRDATPSADDPWAAQVTFTADQPPQSWADMDAKDGGDHADQGTHVQQQ